MRPYSNTINYLRKVGIRIEEKERERVVELSRIEISFPSPLLVWMTKS